MFIFKEKQQVLSNDTTTWFRFLVLRLKASTQKHSFMFSGAKAVLQLETEIVPYFPVSGTP